MQELERAKASGGLSDIIYCFSQEPGMPRTYVQDGIDINADRLAALLATPTAHYYISGAALPQMHETILNLRLVGVCCSGHAPASCYLQESSTDIQGAN
jgi:hypothetical protein